MQRGVYDQVVEGIANVANFMKYGGPEEEGVMSGPLISAPNSSTGCWASSTKARNDGVEIVAGGYRLDRKGYFVHPTVLTNVGPGMRLYRQEIFGPVVGILPFDTEDEAVAMANDTSYGLAATAWTTNVSRAHRIVKRLQAGSVQVNCQLVFDHDLPFGGYKHPAGARSSVVKGSGLPQEQERRRPFVVTRDLCTIFRFDRDVHKSSTPNHVTEVTWRRDLAPFGCVTVGCRYLRLRTLRAGADPLPCESLHRQPARYRIQSFQKCYRWVRPWMRARTAISMPIRRGRSSTRSRSWPKMLPQRRLSRPTATRRCFFPTSTGSRSRRTLRRSGWSRKPSGGGWDSMSGPAGRPPGGAGVGDPGNADQREPVGDLPVWLGACDGSHAGRGGHRGAAAAGTHGDGQGLEPAPWC